MKARRIIGCTAIALAVFIRACVLEAYPPPQNVEGYMMTGIWLLAPVAFFLSVVVFLILGLLKKINLAEQSFDFLCSVIGWALGGLGIASVIIIAISAYYDSPQGPFSIIFLDGPLGVGVGTVVGFVMWLSNVGQNWDLGFRFR
jgi:hypothetical protein